MRKVLPSEVVDMDENEFVSLNERLVHSVCQRIYSDKVKRETGLEYEDLFQAGLVGLVRAKRGFDAELGFQFSTYAVPKIKGEVLRHILLNGRVYVPRPLKEAYFKIVRAGMLTEDAEVIAKELDLSVKQVKRAKAFRMDVASINEMINEDNGEATLVDWISTEESAADVAEENITIQEFVSTLKPTEKRVWEAYKATNCGNQAEVAKIVGVSQVQVSRLLKRIFLKAEDFGKKIMA